MSQIFYVRRIMDKILGTKKEAEQNRTYLKIRLSVLAYVLFMEGRLDTMLTLWPNLRFFKQCLIC